MEKTNKQKNQKPKAKKLNLEKNMLFNQNLEMALIEAKVNHLQNNTFKNQQEIVVFE